MNRKELEQKKELARLLYMQGDFQKDIAVKINISEPTLSKWANEGKWAEQRTASCITRPELINKILRAMDQLIEKQAQSDDIDMASLADKLAKLSATIERLDKKASIVNIIEVFSAFSIWLQQRVKEDDTLTIEKIKDINILQDAYVSETMYLKGASR